MDRYAKEMFQRAESVPTNVLVRVLLERFAADRLINGEDYCRDLAAQFHEAAEIAAERKKVHVGRDYSNLTVAGVGAEGAD